MKRKLESQNLQLLWWISSVIDRMIMMFSCQLILILSLQLIKSWGWLKTLVFQLYFCHFLFPQWYWSLFQVCPIPSFLNFVYSSLYITMDYPSQIIWYNRFLSQLNQSTYKYISLSWYLAQSLFAFWSFGQNFLSVW